MSKNNPEFIKPATISGEAPLEDEKLATRAREHYSIASGQEAEEAARRGLQMAGSGQQTDRQLIEELRREMGRDPVQTTLLEELRQFEDQGLRLTNKGELSPDSLQAIDLLLTSAAALRIVSQQRLINDIDRENWEEDHAQNALLLANRNKRVRAGQAGTYTAEEFQEERDLIEQRKRRRGFTQQELNSYHQTDPNNPLEYSTIRGLANRILELARELQGITPVEPVPVAHYKIIEKPSAHVETLARRNILALSALVEEYRRRQAEVSGSKLKAVQNWLRTRMGDK